MSTQTWSGFKSLWLKFYTLPILSTPNHLPISTDTLRPKNVPHNKLLQVEIHDYLLQQFYIICMDVGPNNKRQNSSGHKAIPSIHQKSIQSYGANVDIRW